MLLSDNAKQALREYKYTGQDLSLTKKYVLDPFWDVCMLAIPRWLAPNVITLSGLCLVIAAQATMVMYSGTLDNAEMPAWVYLAGGLAVFGYQTLDNLDGRQARRTGTSSPLGHMFDHCLDCINILLTGVNSATVFALGPSALSFVMVWVGGFLPFFYATYDEHVTGEMILPAFNGPIEGLLLVVTVHLSTYFLGPHIWFVELPVPAPPAPLDALVPVVQTRHLMVAITGAIAVVTIANNTISMLKYQRKQGKAVLPVLVNLTFFWAWSGAALFWMVASPANLMASHPRLAIWTVGLAFTDCINYMILTHLTHESFSAWRLSSLPVFALALNAAFKIVADDSPILYASFVLEAALVARFYMQVIAEVTVLLDINCFTIKKSKRKST